MSAVIGRTVDGEAAPDESLRLARHLSECTACRILLARERRLAEALNGMEDEAIEEDAFRARVMDALGSGAYPRLRNRPRSARRRGLRLAVWLAVVPALDVARHLSWRFDWNGFGLAFGRPDLERAAGLLVGWAGAAASALSGATAGIPSSPAFPGFAGITAGGMLVAAALCGLGSAAALVGAARLSPRGLRLGVPSAQAEAPDLLLERFRVEPGAAGRGLPIPPA
jgi:anti-sigma factor RsiW